MQTICNDIIHLQWTQWINSMSDRIIMSLTFKWSKRSVAVETVSPIDIIKQICKYIWLLAVFTFAMPVAFTIMVQLLNASRLLFTWRILLLYHGLSLLQIIAGLLWSHSAAKTTYQWKTLQSRWCYQNRTRVYTSRKTKVNYKNRLYYTARLVVWRIQFNIPKSICVSLMFSST